MSDLVKWLRAYADRTTIIDIKRLDEAADEITRLRVALRDARAEVLEEAAKVAENYDGPGMESAPDATWGDAQATKDDIAYYIRALKEKA